jgi:hypothetical protein
MLVLGGGCCCISEIPLHRGDSQLGTRNALGSYGEASPGSIYAHPWGGALLTSTGARIQLPQGTLSKEVCKSSFSFRLQTSLDHRDFSSHSITGISRERGMPRLFPRLCSIAEMTRLKGLLESSFFSRLQTSLEVNHTHRSKVFRYR